MHALRCRSDIHYQYRALDSHYRAEGTASMEPKYVPYQHSYRRGARNQRNHGCARNIRTYMSPVTREYCKCQFSSETDRTLTVSLRFSVHCYGDVYVLRCIDCVSLRMRSFPGASGTHYTVYSYSITRCF